MVGVPVGPGSAGLLLADRGRRWVQAPSPLLLPYGGTRGSSCRLSPRDQAAIVPAVQAVRAEVASDSVHRRALDIPAVHQKPVPTMLSTWSVQFLGKVLDMPFVCVSRRCCNWAGSAVAVLGVVHAAVVVNDRCFGELIVVLVPQIMKVSAEVIQLFVK